MKLYSTNDRDNIVSLREAVLDAFPKDRGLYIPMNIPRLPSSFFNSLESKSFQEIAFTVCSQLIQTSVPKSELEKIIDKAISFPAPLKIINERLSVLELFHGPTMAFKDFGARFMAELMSYFLRNENRVTTILVATSGDTGGAVASGFYQVKGINVIILYPKGKVSPLQQKQLTTWGSNIMAVEIDGTFDDCQRLVKDSFLDRELRQKYTFSSANSINIARLIPQSFYYFEAYKQLGKKENIIFSVPSGNFGNLTAGLIAKKMGLPISKFIAATNVNDTVPKYIKTGFYNAKKSQQTISNAMDVGDPSNFVRMKALCGSTWNMIKKEIIGYSFNDKENKKAMKALKEQYNYISDPHGALGYLASIRYLAQNYDENIIFLETAHPAKFAEVVHEALNEEIPIPIRLSQFMNKTELKNICSNDFNQFKKLLLTL